MPGVTLDLTVNETLTTVSGKGDSVRVFFRTRRLERCYAQESMAIRTWGPYVGRRYIERVNILMQVRDFDELADIPPLCFHPLTGDRAGQYAIRLTGQVRLVFALTGPNAVTVEEVVDYHG